MLSSVQWAISYHFNFVSVLFTSGIKIQNMRGWIQWMTWTESTDIYVHFSNFLLVSFWLQAVPGCIITGIPFTHSENPTSGNHEDHADEALRCPKCDRLQTERWKWILHVRTCNPTSFRCNYCCREFRSQLGRDKHRRIFHEKILPFKCQKCDKSFTSKPNLEGHMNTHFNLKPFKCDACGSAFPHRYAVYRHKKFSCRPFALGHLSK